ncbi:MAG: LCP family protein [Clostridia bacterium]|nr:LCP family protein [Clostridia bacterium]
MADKKKRRKKKGGKKSPKPWPFVIFVLLLSGFFSYAWGVWYVPSLPKAEVPPFLLTDGSMLMEKDAVTVPLEPTDTAAPSAQKGPSPPSSQKGTEAPAEPPKVESPVTTASVPADTQPPKEKEQVPETDPHARKKGVYNILVAGKDDAALNTDVLILVSYDTENQTAAAVQIPRDTYCDGHKINALYGKYRSAASKSGSKDPTAAGMRSLCDTLEQTLAVRVDHWVLVDTNAFCEVVDAVGGVDVNIPCNMDYEDPAQELYIHLSAGEQHLDGAQAEQFVRFRSDYIRGDLGRVDMQKLFLTALFRQCHDNISILSLPAVVTAGIRHVKCDLSFSDMIFFAKSIRGLDMENLTFMTLPGTDARENGDSGAWYYILSAPACARLTDNYLNVYVSSVSAHFDPGGRLTNPSKPALDKLYRTDVTISAHTADAIAENGIRVDTYRK